MSMHWLYHSWGKWVVKDEGNIVNYRQKSTGLYIIQQRACDVCVKLQLKLIKHQIINNGGSCDGWEV